MTVDQKIEEQQQKEQQQREAAIWRAEQAAAEANLLRGSEVLRDRLLESIRIVEPEPQPYRLLSEDAKQAIRKHAEQFRYHDEPPSPFEDPDGFLEWRRRQSTMHLWTPQGGVVGRVDDTPPAPGRPEFLRQMFGAMTHFYVAASGRYAGSRIALPDHVDTTSGGYVEILEDWVDIDLDDLAWSPNQPTLYGAEAVKAVAEAG